jgi:hypothetical protein
MEPQNKSRFVMPAEAGNQSLQGVPDFRWRGNDVDAVLLINWRRIENHASRPSTR